MKSLTTLLAEAETAYSKKNFELAQKLCGEILGRASSKIFRRQAEALLRKIRFGAYDIRAAAVALYGEGLPDWHYIDLLHNQLEMSVEGVRKLWYYQRGVSGPVQKLLNLEIDRIKAINEDTPAESLVGHKLPDEAFENEPGDRIDEIFRNMTEAEVDELVERHERALAGDEDAWDGWQRPGG